jgi:hypothetical protein
VSGVGLRRLGVLMNMHARHREVVLLCIMSGVSSLGMYITAFSKRYPIKHWGGQIYVLWEQ